jgi:hypothetical protein
VLLVNKRPVPVNVMRSFMPEIVPDWTNGIRFSPPGRLDKNNQISCTMHNVFRVSMDCIQMQGTTNSHEQRLYSHEQYR